MNNKLHTLALAAALTVSIAYPSTVLAGEDDHPLLGRYPGALNTNHPRSTSFDVVELPAGPMTKSGPEEVIELEGRIRWDGFVGPSDASEIAVGRSYEAVLEENGFEMLFSCVGEECGDLTSFLTDRSFMDMGEPVRDVSAGWGWKHYVRYNDRVRFYLAKKESDEGIAHALVYVSRYAPRDTHMFIGQIIVESAPLEIKAIEADELQEGLETEGRVIVPGIFFASDSAEVLPESTEALEQMTLLLNNKPELQVFIVGHTDTQGSFDYNQSLSERRAQAILQVLADDFSIDPARMTAKGVAFLAPVASNRTEDGQAQNRRVELVAIE